MVSMYFVCRSFYGMRIGGADAMAAEEPEGVAA